MAAPRIYARLYVEARTHEKIWTLTDSQYRFYFDAIMWARERRTDGFIDARMLSQISPVRRPLACASALQKLSLFDAADGGWWIHDYSTHQDTNDVISNRLKARRKAAAETNQHRWGSG